MSKHTPGPWLITEKADPKIISSWYIQIGKHSVPFFPYTYQFADEAKTCGGYVSWGEMHANARLIASAPRMLEALKAAEFAMRNEIADPQDSGAYQSVVVAIAEAEGEKK